MFLTQLIEEFEEVTFEHLTRDKNQFADALATLAAMIQLDYGVMLNPYRLMPGAHRYTVPKPTAHLKNYHGSTISKPISRIGHIQ